MPERTFAEQARSMSTPNLELALRNLERGLQTSEDIIEWARLAGKRDAFATELRNREDK